MWKKRKKTWAVLLVLIICTNSMFVQASEPSKQINSGEASPTAQSSAQMESPSSLIFSFDMENIANQKVTNAVDGKTFVLEGNQTTPVQSKTNYGKALRFDGKTNYINLGTGYQITTGQATISAWVNVDENHNQWARILSRTRTGKPDDTLMELGLMIRENDDSRSSRNTLQASVPR